MQGSAYSKLAGGEGERKMLLFELAEAEDIALLVRYTGAGLAGGLSTYVEFSPPALPGEVRGTQPLLS